MLRAGFWILEPVYSVGQDGLVHLRKLPSRLPGTVFRWIMERDGGLREIVQRAVNPATGGIEQVALPIEELLVFVHDREAADWTGLSVLRSAYEHRYMKDWLYRIGAINVERGGGFPVITLPPDADETDLGRAADVGESIHLHERAYVLEPAEWKFRMDSGTTRVGDVMSQVDHHDRKIAANILAPFLDFGMGALGSRGTAAEGIDLFLMAEEAVIGNIEETVNRYPIQRWVDYNWRVPGYPRLKGTKCSKAQPSHRKRAKPCSSTPPVRNSRNSRSTNCGRPVPSPPRRAIGGRAPAARGEFVSRAGTAARRRARICELD